MAEGELTTKTPSDEREERTQQLVYGAIVALTALGLAASAARLVDYLRPLPLFCSVTAQKPGTHCQSLPCSRQ